MTLASSGSEMDSSMPIHWDESSAILGGAKSFREDTWSCSLLDSRRFKPYKAQEANKKSAVARTAPVGEGEGGFFVADVWSSVGRQH